MSPEITVSSWNFADRLLRWEKSGTEVMRAFKRCPLSLLLLESTVSRGEAEAAAARTKRKAELLRSQRCRGCTAAGALPATGTSRWVTSPRSKVSHSGRTMLRPLPAGLPSSPESAVVSAQPLARAGAVHSPRVPLAQSVPFLGCLCHKNDCCFQTRAGLSWFD